MEAVLAKALGCLGVHSVRFRVCHRCVVRIYILAIHEKGGGEDSLKEAVTGLHIAMDFVNSHASVPVNSLLLPEDSAELTDALARLKVGASLLYLSFSAIERSVPLLNKKGPRTNHLPTCHATWV